jgi:hypothetical protein
MLFLVSPAGAAVVNQAATRLGPLGFHPLHLRPLAYALRLPLKDTKVARSGCSHDDSERWADASPLMHNELLRVSASCLSRAPHLF